MLLPVNLREADAAPDGANQSFGLVFYKYSTPNGVGALYLHSHSTENSEGAARGV